MGISLSKTAQSTCRDKRKAHPEAPHSHSVPAAIPLSSQLLYFSCSPARTDILRSQRHAKLCPGHTTHTAQATLFKTHELERSCPTIGGIAQEGCRTLLETKPTSPEQLPCQTTPHLLLPTTLSTHTIWLSKEKQKKEHTQKKQLSSTNAKKPCTHSSPGRGIHRLTLYR